MSTCCRGYDMRCQTMSGRCRENGPGGLKAFGTMLPLERKHQVGNLKLLPQGVRGWLWVARVLWCINADHSARGYASRLCRVLRGSDCE